MDKKDWTLPIVQVDFNMPERGEKGRIGKTFPTWWDQIEIGSIVIQACIEEGKDGDGELFGCLAQVTDKSVVPAPEGSFNPFDRHYVWSKLLKWDAERLVKESNDESA